MVGKNCNCQESARKNSVSENGRRKSRLGIGLDKKFPTVGKVAWKAVKN